MKYDIIGNYKNTSEVIDIASDLKEAKYLVKEYQLSFGNKWIITYKINK